jgi:hypothetical protein
MDPKIYFMVMSSVREKMIVLKCLWNLGEMYDFPPPGGPIAQISIASMRVLKGCLGSFLSYQPP